MNYLDLGAETAPAAVKGGIRLFIGTRPQRSRARTTVLSRRTADRAGAAIDRVPLPARDRPPVGEPRTPSRTALPQTDGRALRGPRIDRNKHSEKIECGTAGHRSLGAIFSETRKLSGSLEVNPWFTECPLNINTAWYAPATEAGPSQRVSPASRRVKRAPGRYARIDCPTRSSM